MANTQLFQSTRGAFVLAAVGMNSEGAPAYRFSPKHLLAQYAVTGCLNNTFYASGADQLEKVLELSKELDAEFIAKTAVYARENASMKDMPALLPAVLSTRSPEYLRRVFDRVVDNGRMLRNFVQIIRSGAVGRKSLGSAPKALVQKWLSSANDRRLIEAAVGCDPSLADIVRMVHPKPNDPVREAFYGWLLGKPYALESLPRKLQEYVVYKFDRSQEFPDVPFQMLTARGLGRDEWAMIARRGLWHMVRMNLNTFARHGVFEIDGMARVVADKLRDPVAIQKARALPCQLLAAYRAPAPALWGGSSAVEHGFHRIFVVGAQDRFDYRSKGYEREQSRHDERRGWRARQDVDARCASRGGGEGTVAQDGEAAVHLSSHRSHAGRARG